MYHRQIFKLLLSNKVLDEPRQRRLFKTTDLVELFNLNEPIGGEPSESDRLFRESKLTPNPTEASKVGFSLSKIEKMRKLASALSKKISATVKSTHSENENANDRSICESMYDEQNNNSKRIQVLAVKNDLSDDQAKLSSDQIDTQNSSSGCNKDSNTNLNVDVTKSSNTTDNNTSEKDDCEQDAIPMRFTNDDSVKEKSVSLLSMNDEVIPSSVHKRKKHKSSNRKNISAMFEGERVSCLIGRRLGRSCEREESLSTTDDDYVLRKLFAKSSNCSDLILIFIY